MILCLRAHFFRVPQQVQLKKSSSPHRVSSLQYPASGPVTTLRDIQDNRKVIKSLGFPSCRSDSGREGLVSTAYLSY